MRKKGLLIALGALALSQFIQPDRTAPQHDPADVLLVHEPASPEVAELLHSACYDCHSDATTYPWYSYVTPLNFWLQGQVNEGREEFNMSAWGGMKTKWKDHKKKEAIEMLKKKEMPLSSYAYMHKEAQLTQDQRVALTSFFNSITP